MRQMDMVRIQASRHYCNCGRRAILRIIRSSWCRRRLAYSESPIWCRDCGTDRMEELAKTKQETE